MRVVLVLWLLLAPFALADGECNKHSRPLPVVTRMTKDSSTSLYLISVRNYDAAPLVLDLAGPLIWLACFNHHTIPCSSGLCAVANRNHPPNCPYVDGGRPGSGPELLPNCNCTAYPYNPVDGRCGNGDLTRAWLSANATDGERPLYPVSFRAVASCAPLQLEESLPTLIINRWTVRHPGVAGLSWSPLSLPAQVARELKVADKFALCHPHVAIFGGGPFRMPRGAEAGVGPISSYLTRTRLLRNPKNSAYYIDVTGIAVNGARVPLPDRALALDAGQGQGGVALSTVTPYTALRSDVYRAVLEAFGAATAGIPRAEAAPAPFELCYNLTALQFSMAPDGYPTATIDLMLADGKNWTFSGYSATLEAAPLTLCLAFVEMGPAAASAVPRSPAIIIGGYQMENNYLEFDLKKGVLAYSGLLIGHKHTPASCSNFYFEYGLGP